MTFIKTASGDYINAADVKLFHATDGGSVHAITKDGDTFIVNVFSTDSEAQDWLDDLIDELESDDD